MTSLCMYSTLSEEISVFHMYKDTQQGLVTVKLSRALEATFISTGFDDRWKTKERSGDHQPSGITGLLSPNSYSSFC